MCECLESLRHRCCAVSLPVSVLCASLPVRSVLCVSALYISVPVPVTWPTLTGRITIAQRANWGVIFIIP